MAVNRPLGTAQADLVGRHLDDVPTPCVVVDDERLERNLRRYAAIAARHDVALRPHAKAHKSPVIAQRQLDAGAAGLAVAKASEAEVFVEHGCTDVTVAYPVVAPDACARLAGLAEQAIITVQADSEAGLDALSGAAHARGTTLRVLIELDAGLGRSGLPAGD